MSDPQVWHGEVNGRTFVVRSDGGLYQANELCAEWVSLWTESLQPAVEEIGNTSHLPRTLTRPEGMITSVGETMRTAVTGTPLRSQRSST